MPKVIRFLFLLAAVLCFLLAAFERRSKWNVRWLPLGLAFFVGTFLWDIAEQL